MRFIKFSDCQTAATKKDLGDTCVSGAPEQKVWSHFMGNDDKFLSGMWESTAGVFKGPMDNQIEFCHILEGEATIKTPDGETYHVVAGDAFVMDNGLQPEWHVDRYVKKHYVICKM